MDNLKIYGIIICALCACLVFKNFRSEYSLFIRLIVTIGISTASLIAIFPALKYINEISKGTVIENYMPSLIKALGIAFAVQITADTCKDADEIALANRICLFGQVEIFIISIPIIKSLFELCGKILG